MRDYKKKENGDGEYYLRSDLSAVRTLVELVFN
jgi:hypothetical protein